MITEQFSEEMSAFGTDEKFPTNVKNINGVIEALCHLRDEANQTGNEDIATMISATFDIVVTTYVMLLRETAMNTGDLSSLSISGSREARN